MTQNNCDFTFSFQVDENNAYRGTTQTVLGFIYFIRDNNNILYWTIFTDEDRKINPVKKPVRLGKKKLLSCLCSCFLNCPFLFFDLN